MTAARDRYGVRFKPRSPEEVERWQKAEEARLRELSKPTGHPMPRWLTGDTSGLPKKPPRGAS